MKIQGTYIKRIGRGASSLLLALLTGFLATRYAYAETRELPLPEIPSDLSTRSEKMVYLLTHFWDGMEWEHATATNDPLYLEQNLSNFFSVVAVADSVEGSQGVKMLMQKSAPFPDVKKTIGDLAETYLYNPTSPYYNAESYILFADYLRTDTLTDQATRERAEYAHSQIMKNRIGNRATDFEFADMIGSIHRLSATANTAPLKLLLFYDTDCHDCHKLRDLLIHNKDAETLTSSGLMQIIAIEAYGADREHWLHDARQWPEGWIIGRSPEGEVDAEEIYVLLTTPSIYMLDQNYTVVAKDLTTEQLLELLAAEVVKVKS